VAAETANRNPFQGKEQEHGEEESSEEGGEEEGGKEEKVAVAVSFVY